MSDATPLPFYLPSVHRKKLTVYFTGGNQSSDAGLLLLRRAERNNVICGLLAAAMPYLRYPGLIQHYMFEIVMALVSAIACCYEDGIYLYRLRHDPLMKVAVCRCPTSGAPLASQSTISRLENAPSLVEAALLTAALIYQTGTTVTPRRQEILTSTTLSVPRIALSSLRSGTPITTSAASRLCTSTTWRAALRGHHPAPCAHPEAH